MVFVILQSECGLSSTALLPFLSCQMAAGPDLTSGLLHITETALQGLSKLEHHVFLSSIILILIFIPD